jgi:protein-disulfide isomerase
MKNRNSSRHMSRTLVLVSLAVAGGCTKKAPQGPAVPLPPPTIPGTAPAAAPTAAPVANDHAQATGQAPPAAYDLGKLDPAERKIFDQVVSHQPSACGKGHSLLDSTKTDKACPASFYAVRYVARLADAGFSEAEIDEKLEQRFRTPRATYIDVSQAPSKGNPAGRVKIVEFADYQCGHCKAAQAMMHTLLAEYAQDIIVYFKHFPLGGHVASVNAAVAAVAAQTQGKFWQMSDKIWENQDRLSPALLEGVAKDIGLDFARWYADVGSEEVRNHVQRDRAEGRSLEIHRTPAIFINGRLYPEEPDLPGLKDWIDEELGR